MRIRSKIIAFLAIIIQSCSEDAFDINNFPDDPAITTLNGTWRVISFENFSEDRTEYKTHENSWDRDIVVTFDDTSDPDWFSGRNTTNSVFGEFDYLSNRQFKLRRLGTTFASQPEWGDKFSAAVCAPVCGGAVPFKISSEHLRFYFDNGRQSVTLIRE